LKTTDHPDGIAAEAFAALQDSWRKDYPQWIVDNTEPFFVAATQPAIKRWLSGMLMQFPGRIAIECNKAIAGTDFRAELRNIPVPSLVIHGDRDVSAPLPLTGTPTAALIPGCRLEVYEGAPHGLLYTHMDRLHADILGFLRQRH
jgi:non-heme chloroperoxidase